MSIVIRGMEMPKDICGEPGYVDVRIFSDGSVIMVKAAPPYYGKYEAVPIPEGHGRLIDAEALERVCKEIADCEWNKKAAPYSWEYAYNQFIDDEIFNAPTIVPAEGGS